MAHKFSIGFRSGLFAGQSITVETLFEEILWLLCSYVILLESPLLTEHLVSFRKMFSYDIDIKLTGHDFAKTKETGLSFNTETAPDINSGSVFRNGRISLYQYSIVFRNNQNNVSSVKSVRFQLSLICFWAHSIRFSLCFVVSIGVASGRFLSYPRRAKCRKTVT